MKVAIPVCADEIATTADFAREILVVDCDGAREVGRARLLLEETVPVNRAKRVLRMGVQAVICGAISRSLAELLVDSGVQIVPLVSGSVDEVIAAFLSDRLGGDSFLLPGCTAEERQRLLGVRTTG